MQLGSSNNALLGGRHWRAISDEDDDDNDHTFGLPRLGQGSALQLLGNTRVCSAQTFKKRNTENTKEDQNISFGVSVTADENWVIEEELFQTIYPITKRNQNLKIKLRAPELH